MNDEQKKAWEKYLKEQQADAPRAALRNAVIGEPEDSTTQRGHVDGSSQIQIAFTPPPEGSRWQLAADSDDGTQEISQ